MSYWNVPRVTIIGHISRQSPRCPCLKSSFPTIPQSLSLSCDTLCWGRPAVLIESKKKMNPPDVSLGCLVNTSSFKKTKLNGPDKILKCSVSQCHPSFLYDKSVYRYFCHTNKRGQTHYLSLTKTFIYTRCSRQIQIE